VSIFQTIGLIWIILTSALATVAIFYLAYAGLKYLVRKDIDLPAEFRKMFKITTR